MNVSGCRNLFDIAEEKIKKTEDGQTYAPDSIAEWKDNCINEMQHYLALPDDFRYTLMQYLVFAKQQETGSVDYSEIYNSIY